MTSDCTYRCQHAYIDASMRKHTLLHAGYEQLQQQGRPLQRTLWFGSNADMTPELMTSSAVAQHFGRQSIKPCRRKFRLQHRSDLPERSDSSGAANHLCPRKSSNNCQMTSMKLIQTYGVHQSCLGIIASCQCLVGPPLIKCLFSVQCGEDGPIIHWVQWLIILSSNCWTTTTKSLRACDVIISCKQCIHAGTI